MGREELLFYRSQREWLKRASESYENTAKIRGFNVDQDGISPSRHAEVNSWDELLDLIGHIREVTGKPVSIKAVVGAEKALQDLCKIIVKRGVKTVPDSITIDGGEGGTGVAPKPLIDLVGISVREALPLAAGADLVTSAPGFMFSLGCIQALPCNKKPVPWGSRHMIRVPKKDWWLVKSEGVGLSIYTFFKNKNKNKNDEPELLMKAATWWIECHKLDHLVKATKFAR